MAAAAHDVKHPGLSADYLCKCEYGRFIFIV
jgi:hypothetical protein